MTAMTFDTLAYAKKLKEAGVPEAQAEAQTAALAEALRQSTVELATRDDIERLRTDFKTLDISFKQELRVLEERTAGRFRLLQWMLGFVLALLVAVLWMLIRIATLA